MPYINPHYIPDNYDLYKAYEERQARAEEEYEEEERSIDPDDVEEDCYRASQWLKQEAIRRIRAEEDINE